MKLFKIIKEIFKKKEHVYGYRLMNNRWMVIGERDIRVPIIQKYDKEDKEWMDLKKKRLEAEYDRLPERVQDKLQSHKVKQCISPEMWNYFCKTKIDYII